jgi:sugar phosphate isomerase/epimerase
MKIGMMNNPSAPVVDEVAAIGKAGYDFVDLTMEAPQALEVDTQKLLPLLRQHALEIVGHTDPCLPYAYPIDRIRRACLQELERCARIFADLGAGIMNIHPCYTCPPAMKRSLVELNIAALREVVRMAAGNGLTVVLENFRPPFDAIFVFQRMLREVPGLKLHLDVGHTHFGRDDAAAFCRHLGEHIAHVHLSDNRSRADDHMPLGVGSVPWREAVDGLKKTGYDGTITLEVFCGEPAVMFQYLAVSRDFLRQLWQG